MKLELCNFSGYKIYPGKGRTFVRGDSRTFRFINGKNESYFLQKLKPSKLNWTVKYRTLHKKGAAEEVLKKRRTKTVKTARDIVGASLEAIKAKRNQKPEQRALERQKAVAAAKEKKKVEQDKKKAEKAKSAASRPAGGKAAQPKMSKMQARGAATKVAAKSR
ncbi:ribosomal protein L24e-domain-containing protein [Hyaloraphidium curvatum]|nr:ribosomal protein L24e-domain-containing protein [Hyaloraphidium curvatum]